MLPHRIPSGGNSPLSGFMEGCLNGMFVDPAKIGPGLFKINGLSLDSMFVLSNLGVARGMSESVVNSPLKMAKFINPGVMCIMLGGLWGTGGLSSCGRVGVIQDRWVPFMGTCEQHMWKCVLICICGLV